MRSHPWKRYIVFVYFCCFCASFLYSSLYLKCFLLNMKKMWFSFPVQDIHWFLLLIWFSKFPLGKTLAWLEMFYKTEQFTRHNYNHFRTKAKQARLDKVLTHIRDNAADREAWDMADQGRFLLIIIYGHCVYHLS